MGRYGEQIGYGALVSQAQQLRYVARGVVSRCPRLYIPLARLILRSEHKHLVVGKDTEIVIEGFPRSANTFAYKAFQLSQENKVRVAHHLHAPAQIIMAAKMNIPTVVQIRNPEGTVLSYVIRNPFISIKVALKQYILFYQAILPYRDHFVLAKFEDVIKNFGLIIRQVNNKFNTRFKEFEHNEENVAKCYQIPFSNRKRLKEQLRFEYNNEKLKTLTQKAKSIYQILISKRSHLRNCSRLHMPHTLS